MKRSVLGLAIVIVGVVTGIAARHVDALPIRSEPTAGMCAGVPQTPTVDRAQALPENDDAQRIRAYAKSLGARGAAMRYPCVETNDGRRCQCVRTALEPFYAWLDRARHARTNIVILGNSLIASDGITNIVRDRL